MKPLFGGASLKLRQTQKAVTPFGGLAVFAEFLQRIQWPKLLQECMPVIYRSPNAVDPSQTLTMFMVSVLTGAHRFAHCSLLKADKALHAVFGWERCVGDDAIRGFFRRFGAGEIERLWRPVWQWLLERVEKRQDYTLDLDSTVLVRYGKQEGVVRAYNPQRRGEGSHHPLLAVLSEVNFVLHSWLRAGNTNANSGVLGFLKETLSLAQKAGIGIARLRADAGFYGEELFKWLEQTPISYFVIGRQTSNILRQIQKISQWQKGDGQYEVGEFVHAVGQWKKERRFVVMRRPVREAPQGLLIALPARYIYRVLVTNSSCPAAEAWVIYDGRARIEQRLSELKGDLHADKFCLQSFYGSEAAFLAVLCLYNLLGEFQQATAAKRPWRTPQTLRNEVFLCGAILGRSAQHLVLHFSLAWGGLDQRISLLDKLLLWPTPKTPFLDPLTSTA